MNPPQGADPRASLQAVIERLDRATVKLRDRLQHWTDMKGRTEASEFTAHQVLDAQIEECSSLMEALRNIAGNVKGSLKVFDEQMVVLKEQLALETEQTIRNQVEAKLLVAIADERGEVAGKLGALKIQIEGLKEEIQNRDLEIERLSKKSKKS